MIEVLSVNGIAGKALSGLEIDMPVVMKVGMEDGRMIACGGLGWSGGRCWLWLHVENEASERIGIKVIREARKMLRKAAQLGEEIVYTPRDSSYETSERLLKMVGFEKTDEVILGSEVWRHVRT